LTTANSPRLNLIAGAAAVCLAATCLTAMGAGAQQAADPPSSGASGVDASMDAEYHQELMAAASSLKADIQAESDASAAAVTEVQGGPTSSGMIAAGIIAALGLVAAIVIIPATLRARKRRRAMVLDMISGKPKDKR